MKDDQKTKKQLIEELNNLGKHVAELKGFEEEIGQIRADHEKFTKAFIQNSIPVAIATLKEGRFIDVSGAFLVFMECKRNEVIGHTSAEIGFITEEERASFIHELNKKGRIQNIEVKFRTKGGALKYGLLNAVMISIGNEKCLLSVMTDITDRKQTEDELVKYREGLEKMIEERTRELEGKTKTLEEANIALKVLLHHRDEDKRDFEDRFVMNVKNLIMPYAEKLKSTRLDERQLAYLGIMEANLSDITTSMIKKMYQFNFTPTEVEVASLIKEGMATKEIAKIIGIAASSVNTHRNNIRKKLGISNEDVNLRAHLQSLN